jgi:fibro-slime domain-containing protein
MMTLLAQDLLDFNDGKYFPASGPVDSLGANADIGTSGDPQSGGSYVYNNGNQTLTAGGSDIQNAQDHFRFAYNTTSGDCNFTVRVISMTNPSGSYGWSKAGIMIRQSLNNNSQYVMATATPTPANGVTFQSRKTAGAGTNQTIAPSSVSLPVWLQLTRAGNIFTVFYSTNGSAWTMIQKDTVAMTDPVFAGIAVTSHTTGSLEPAQFSNFSGFSRTICDTVKVSADSVPVIYTITKLGTNLFNMSTYAYVLKGTTQGRNYETHLTQMLSRESVGQWHEDVHGFAYIPVTMYDMRADMSNPEFNMNGSEAPPPTHTFLPAHYVKNDTLDPDRKPVILPNSDGFKAAYLKYWNLNWYNLTANQRKIENDTIQNSGYDSVAHALVSPHTVFDWDFNDSMRTWFRPWGDSTGKTGTYTFDPTTGRWSGLKKRPKVGGGTTSDSEWVTAYWDSTNPFANIVMYDSLKFIERPFGSGIFVFGDTNDTRWFDSCTGCGWNQINFFPLKNKGFGFDCHNRYPYPNNWFDTACYKSTNYAYTLEIHRTFSYKPGQTFIFTGDDDVWVFINDSLVIDLGGVHQALSDTVSLDDLHLTAGQKYPFDFFYCERCVNASHIFITTNLMFYIPPQPLKRSWKRDYGNLD